MVKEETRILERILHGIMVTDMRGHIIYCNPSNVKIFGYSKSDIEGMSIRTLHDEDDKMPFRSLIDKINQDKPVIMRWHGIHKNGQRVWLDIRASLIPGTNDEPDSCVISLHKIDDLKETEMELSKNKAFAETILDATADGIISVNEEGEIIQVNDTVRRMFGYSWEELAGRSVKMLVPLTKTHDIDYYLGRLESSNGGDYSVDRKETQALRKDGTSFPVELSVSEVTWDGRKIHTAIIKDLTSRRKLEKRILEIGNEERKKIGSELHDGLGQMLTGIRLQAEFVARRLKANGVPGANEIEEIAGLLQDADEEARLIAQGMVATDIDQKGLSRAINKLCERVRKSSGIKCSVNLSEKIDHIQDQSVALNIFRIIQEAVNNAVKYSQAENLSIELTSNPHLYVKIEDDGVGFDPDAKDISGSGIAIMNHRAKVLGGEFEIERTGENRTAVKCEFPNLTS